MDLTPWDFLNIFSSLLSVSAVGSISNSKGESGTLIGVGALDSCGGIGGGAGPVGMPVSSWIFWTFGVSPGSRTLVGEELGVKLMLRLAAVAG